MNVANPRRTTVDELATMVAQAPKEETVYAVFNDPAHVDHLVQTGQIPEAMRELFSRELWSSPLPGPALRFMRWTNEQRAQNPEALGRFGNAMLMEQRVTRTPWRVIDEVEQEGIDDGRRPNG